MPHLFESVVETPKRIIPASLAATERVVVAEKVLLNVDEDERIAASAWALVDANAGLVGLTMGIAFFDARYPTGYWQVRWPAGMPHKWGGGNVKRYDGEHHKALTAEGNYISSKFQRRVTFKLWICCYSTAPAGLSATVQDAIITFDRYKPGA